MNEPILQIAQGLAIPFLGTVLGAACVFFMRKQMSQNLKRGLLSFAAGVMVAASVWSLLLPAISASESMGKLAFIPATVGFWAGILFLYILDKITPCLHLGSDTPEGLYIELSETELAFNGQRGTPDELREKAATVQNKKSPVAIKIDKGTTYERIAIILDILQVQKLYNIQLINEMESAE